MKKTYMQPLTLVVKINAEQMICESNVSQRSTEITNDNKGGFTKADKYDDFDFSDDLW